MHLTEIATIGFRDLDSGDEGVATVRASKGELALRLTLKQDGDVEVFLGPGDRDRLLVALQHAALVVRGQA